jgi:hypothetical protein
MEKWNALSIEEIKLLMNSVGVLWWIAGGYALDLYIGKNYRVHEDIDIGIFRKDFRIIQTRLEKEWLLYKTNQPGLVEMKKGESLPDNVHQVWIRKDYKSFWALEILIDESENNLWVYRREPKIHLPISKITNKLSDDLLYLKPEIQLLYKGGTKYKRDKDDKDFKTILPLLDIEQRQWLLKSLIIQYPQGHDWIKSLECV